MKVVFIESPNKRESIKKYLGNEYVVFATKGHFRDLPAKSFAIDLNNNYKPSFEIMPAKKAMVAEMQKLSEKADAVYLATDPDREGEAIAWHIATILNLDSKAQVRTSFNEISKKAVLNSIDNPKTGVDFDQYKNMVGAFCMPKLVYMNLATLNTLDRRVYLSGMGEVIKYGLIRRPEFYQWIGQHVQAIKNRDPEAVLHMVSVSCDTKRIVVEEDPLERSVRALLNLGHTLGHAIEKKKDFSLYHGECVAIGMVAAAQMSYKRGYLTAEQVEELKELLQLFELPIDVDGLNPQEVLDATKNDKKMIAGQIKFILLKAIGEGIVDRTVTEEEMAEGLSAVLK